jgi:hypothetical protein
VFLFIPEAFLFVKVNFHFVSFLLAFVSQKAEIALFLQNTNSKERETNEIGFLVKTM